MQSANPRQGMEKKKKGGKPRREYMALNIRNALFLSCAVVCIVLYIFRVIYSREGESCSVCAVSGEGKKKGGLFWHDMNMIAPTLVLQIVEFRKKTRGEKVIAVESAYQNRSERLMQIAEREREREREKVV